MKPEGLGLGHYRIVVLCVGAVSLHTALLAVEPFRAANRLGAVRRFNVAFASIQGGAMETMVGIPFPTMAMNEIVKPPDLVFLLASYETDPLVKRPLFPWLRRMWKAGVRLAALDYAPLLLAEAGLLSGRRATAHWTTLGAFAERHLDVAVEDRLFIINGNLATGAGQVSAIDLSMALLRDAVTPELLRNVQDELVLAPRITGDAPQQDRLADVIDANPRTLERAKYLMELHIEEPLPMEQIARKLGISLRELQRRFRQQIGQTPAECYRDIRLNRAVHLLCYSQLAIREIGMATGFPEPSTFFRAFRQRFKIGPQTYRARFLAEPNSPDGRRTRLEVS